MRIHRIKIHDILGIEELEIEPGKLTVVSGPNGSGKTSVLEAIRAVAASGEDATLLRKGAKDGEIVIILDDGTDITRRLTPKTTTTTVRKDGEVVKNPKTFIKELVDALSLNPLEFLTAKPKDRVSVVLESLPLKADPTRISEIMGRPVEIDDDEHAFSVLDRLQAQIYSDRTATNRTVKDKESSIGQLQQALPPEDAATPLEAGVTADDLQTQADEIAAAATAATARADAKMQEYRSTVDADVQEMMEKIEAIRAKAAEDIEAIRANITARRDWLSEATTRYSARLLAIKEEETKAAQPVRDRLRAIRADAEAMTRAEATRQIISGIRRDLIDLRVDQDRQNTALAGLEAYRVEILSDLPIPGLTVESGELKRDGVAFDRLNTAQQVEIAIKIAQLRAGKLGVICVDGLETLDNDHFAAFQEQALASGLQLIVSRVADHEFTITKRG